MIISTPQLTPIKSSADIAAIMDAIYAARPEEDAHREMFYAVALDSRNRIIVIELVTIGSITQCMPVVRECFRLAVMRDAVAIIVAHNHPSGETRPSPEDNTYTRKLVMAGGVLGIRVLDHIIVGTGAENKKYYSFADDMNMPV